MSLEGFNKHLDLSETASGGLQIPVVYLNTGISSSQVGETQHIDSDFDNGVNAAKVSPAGRQPSPLLAAVEHDGGARVAQQLLRRPCRMSAPRELICLQSMSPLNVIDPHNPAIAAMGTDLRVSYNDPTWSGDLRQVRRERSVCGLGKPDDKLRAHARPGSGALSAVLRSAAGPERTTRNLHLQLLPVPCREALQRRAVCALVADGTEDVHGCFRYHPGDEHQRHRQPGKQRPVLAVPPVPAGVGPRSRQRSGHNPGRGRVRPAVWRAKSAG